MMHRQIYDLQVPKTPPAARYCSRRFEEVRARRATDESAPRWPNVLRLFLPHRNVDNRSFLVSNVPYDRQANPDVLKSARTA